MGEPAASGRSEEIGRRRCADEVAQKSGVDLALEARAGAHELGAVGEPAAQGAQVLARQPGALEQAGREQLGQGAGVATVGLGLGT